MSRFHGPQPGYKGLHGRTKGVLRRFLEERSARIAEQTRKNRRAKKESQETAEEVTIPDSGISSTSSNTDSFDYPGV